MSLHGRASSIFPRVHQVAGQNDLKLVRGLEKSTFKLEHYKDLRSLRFTQQANERQLNT